MGYAKLKEELFLDNIRNVFYFPEKLFYGYIQIKTKNNNILLYYIPNIYSYKCIIDNVVEKTSKRIIPARKIELKDTTYNLIKNKTIEICKNNKTIQTIELQETKNDKYIDIIEKNNEVFLVVINSNCDFNTYYILDPKNKKFYLK